MTSTSARQAPLRALLYAHDGRSLGRVRRHLAIAAALQGRSPRASVLLATDADESDVLASGSVDVLKLPRLRENEPGSDPGSAPDRLMPELRSALLTAAAEAFRPDVVLVDTDPAGVDGELLEALGHVRAGGVPTLLGVPDIFEGTLAGTEAYDRVLVYGDPLVFDSLLHPELPASLETKATFCGYVATPLDGDSSALDTLRSLSPGSEGRALVLATAGGGRDCCAVLETFIEAAAEAPWQAIVVSGPRAGRRERTRLQRAAVDAGVAFRSFVPGLAGWFGMVDALVCTGGYSTLVESVSRGTPTVCIPRMQKGGEQRRRARAFEELGLLTVVEPGQLDADLLLDEVAVALGRSRDRLARKALAAIDLNGADRAAHLLLELAGRESRVAPTALPASLTSAPLRAR